MRMPSSELLEAFWGVLPALCSLGTRGSFRPRALEGRQVSQGRVGLPPWPCADRPEGSTPTEEQEDLMVHLGPTSLTICDTPGAQVQVYACTRLHGVGMCSGSHVGRHPACVQAPKYAEPCSPVCQRPGG